MQVIMELKLSSNNYFYSPNWQSTCIYCLAGVKTLSVCGCVCLCVCVWQGSWGGSFEIMMLKR